MAEAYTISAQPPVNPGEDYVFLREKGIDLVQQLSGSIWTDYNEHDPGVTTLEQLCYALTDLSYRAQFPIADLLTEFDKGLERIDTRRQALFLPRRIFPCNAVTENDYRKLILDNVPGVTNVWINPMPSQESGGVKGLYHIWVYTLATDICSTDPQCNPKQLKSQVRRVYSHSRNLCEDLTAVSILDPLTTVVMADVTVDAAVSVDWILARLFFNLGKFLAPEVQRRSLKMEMAAGSSPAEIFNGPLMRRGFIEDNQLQPKAGLIAVNDIIRVITKTEGVAGVSKVDVQVDVPATSYKAGQSIPVPENKYLLLNTQPDARKRGFSIRLFKNGIECNPNPVRVRYELDKFWVEFRRTYLLAEQYEDFFGVPKGKFRDLEQYYSIQDQYPNVYGINSYGLPADSTPARRGQARQFKGYLLVFEQLLADYFAQLAHVKDLYSMKRDVHQTYFCQELTKSVPNVEPLLKSNYADGLRDLVRSEDPYLIRRNRFLDFLLALYADRLSGPLMTSCQGEQDNALLKRLIHAKLTLLSLLVAATHNRGRGFDYLAVPSPANIAGMEIKCRIQIGMDVSEGHSLTETLDQTGLQLVETEKDASLGKSIQYAGHIEENFVPAASVEATQDISQQHHAKEEFAPLLRSGSVTEEFLRVASDLANYSLGELPGDPGVSLVCKSPAPEGWRMVGKYPDRESAASGAKLLVKLLAKVYRRCLQLYVVEHALLRFGRHLEKETDGSFVYSFTISVVLSAPSSQREDLQFRNMVREVIRQNTPSHIVANCCFLGPYQLKAFELLYWGWRNALRKRNKKQIAEFSARLRKFLQEQCRALLAPKMKEGESEFLD